MLCNLSTSLIVADSIAGGVTKNPIVLGIIRGIGSVLKTYCDIKILKRGSNYVDLLLLKKTLIELRSFMRGVSFDKEVYLDQLNTVDNIFIE